MSSTARPKRGSTNSSSQLAKKTKTSSREVLNAFTANANGGRTRSASSAKFKIDKVEKEGQNAQFSERRSGRSSSASAFMRTLAKFSPSARDSLSRSPLKSSTQTSGDDAKDDTKNSDNENSALSKAEQEILDDFDVPSENEDVPEGDHDEGRAEDPMDESNLVEDDITTPAQSSAGGHSPQRGRGTGSKIVVSDFPDPKLALFAKRCTRMATCIVNMVPEDPIFSWPTVSEEIERLGNERQAQRFLESLNVINDDPDLREQFVRFMNYGTSAVRLDMGREARIRTCQFFGIPGSLAQNQIVSAVQWLLKDRKFHHGVVDIENRTTDGLPFRSPLLGLVLRGYLIKGRPKQDKLLVARLKNEQRIPIPLIVMITVLIGHTLQEYSSGFKVQHAFSQTNIGSHYRAIMSTLSTLQEKAPAYVERLQTELYSEMMTLGDEIVPPQTYNYDALNAHAMQPSITEGGSANNNEEQPGDGDSAQEQDGAGIQTDGALAG